MASQWYYTKEGQQMGPVSSQELKELARTGMLKRTDLIWKDGMPTWGQAGSARNLFPEEHATAHAPQAQPTPRPEQRASAEPAQAEPAQAHPAHAEPAPAQPPSSVAEFDLVEVLDDPPPAEASKSRDADGVTPHPRSSKRLSDDNETK